MSGPAWAWPPGGGRRAEVLQASSTCQVPAAIDAALREAADRCGPIVLVLRGVRVIARPHDMRGELANRWARLRGIR